MDGMKDNKKDVKQNQSKGEELLFQNIQKLNIDEDINQVSAEERYEEF